MMGAMRWGWAGLSLGLAGCVGQPPAPPQDSEGSEGSTSAVTVTASVGDTTAPPGDSTGPGSTSVDVDDGSSGQATTGDTSTGEPIDDDAVLLITDGPLYEWGPVELPQSDQHTFTVTNVGEGEALNMAGQPLTGPYDYVGGAYPGDAGSCGQILAVGESCLVRVVFTPPELGLHDSALTLTHGNGSEVTCALRGGGAGRSENLLVNPGGEDEGSPPPGWTETDAGSWAAGLFMGGPPVFEGDGYIHASTGPAGPSFSLVQEVGVSTWSTTIDQGAMRFSFAGRARGYQFNADEFRMLVLYRDAAGSVLDEFDTGWEPGGFGMGWQLHQNERTAPPGTVTLEVELRCLLNQGEYCDAYFDALELQAVYP